MPRGPVALVRTILMDSGLGWWVTVVLHAGAPPTTARRLLLRLDRHLLAIRGSASSEPLGRTSKVRSYRLGACRAAGRGPETWDAWKEWQKPGTKNDSRCPPPNTFILWSSQEKKKWCRKGCQIVGTQFHWAWWVCGQVWIPGTGEPGGLRSMGSRRVGYDWSDLAAAAVHFWEILARITPSFCLWSSLVDRILFIDSTSKAKSSPRNHLVPSFQTGV